MARKASQPTAVGAGTAVMIVVAVVMGAVLGSTISTLLLMHGCGSSMKISSREMDNEGEEEEDDFGVANKNMVSNSTESYRDRATLRGLRDDQPQQTSATNAASPSSSKSAVVAQTTRSVRNQQIPAELRQEQLSRHELFFGRSGMQKLQQACVVIVGVGGVGSHVAHMLGRAGIGYLRLIDFDQVTLSSLNRHAVATLNDVGISKVQCMADYLQRICPDQRYLQIDSICDMYTAENGPALLQFRNDAQPWSCIVDAIDDVPTKAALIQFALLNNIPVVSCMGAAGKCDMTRLHVSDLRAAAKDPLATKLRQTLRNFMQRQGQIESQNKDVDALCQPERPLDWYLDDMHALSIVYSSENTTVGLADFTSEQVAAGFHHFGAVDGMRIRVLPVLGTMPALMGQSLASLVLLRVTGHFGPTTTLASKTHRDADDQERQQQQRHVKSNHNSNADDGQRSIVFQPVTGERLGRCARHKIFQHFKRREELISKRFNNNSTDDINRTLDEFGGHMSGDGIWTGPIQIDHDDVEYLMEIWRNRCAVTNKRLGVVLELARWDLRRPSLCHNLVLISAKALLMLDQHQQEAQQNGHDMDFPERWVRNRIEKRLATIRVDR